MPGLSAQAKTAAVRSLDRRLAASRDEWCDWRRHYANRLTRPGDLDRIPALSERERDEIGRVALHYPFSITPYYLSLIRWEDPYDPIRMQALPSLQEIEPCPGASDDPLDETAHTVAPGLIRRCQERIVWLATPLCAVYCRHCFRKRLWGLPVSSSGPKVQAAGLAYLASHPEIREVILSGGDPLMLADRRLDEILTGIRRIKHVEIIRIGTRVPVVLPQRITPRLCDLLDRHGPIWLVTQFNHPREITPEAAEACERLLRAGIPVGNQSVLLRGVNDDPETMKSLCRGLLAIRVRPYYMHQCDRVAGAEHFRTKLEAGLEIVEAMEGHISGLAVPKFMVDLPGSGGKVPLQRSHLVSVRGNLATLRDCAGGTFDYENPIPASHVLGDSGPC